MFRKMSLRSLVVLLGTLALSGCSGGNDVTGVHTGGKQLETPTPVVATPVPSPTRAPLTPPPTPRVVPTPCHQGKYGDCINY